MVGVLVGTTKLEPSEAAGRSSFGVGAGLGSAVDTGVAWGTRIFAWVAGGSCFEGRLPSIAKAGRSKNRFDSLG